MFCHFTVIVREEESTHIPIQQAQHNGCLRSASVLSRPGLGTCLLVSRLAEIENLWPRATKFATCFCSMSACTCMYVCVRVCARIRNITSCIIGVHAQHTRAAPNAMFRTLRTRPPSPHPAHLSFYARVAYTLLSTLYVCVCVCVFVLSCINNELGNFSCFDSHVIGMFYL